MSKLRLMAKLADGNAEANCQAEANGQAEVGAIVDAHE